MPLILGTNSIKDTGYDVANSLRFDDGSSDYLSQTQGSGNRRTFTISAWVKRSSGFGNMNLIMSNVYPGIIVRFVSADESFQIYDGGGSSFQLRTNRVFRDVSAWYHLLIAVDTTDGTSGDRIKMYINGTRETSFQTANYPSQNYDTGFNNGLELNIGREAGQSNYFDGYMSEVVVVDGQALDPTSFGEFDEDSPTIWKPIDVSGLTFGTNGFYLDFEDSSALGNDVSGNNNDFTVNNLTAIDQSTDTCTNNFATLNPLATGSLITLSEGNLKATGNNASDSSTTTATIGITSGKFYWEAKIVNVVSGYPYLGIYEDFDSLVQDNLQGQANGTRVMTVYVVGGGTTLFKPSTDLTITAPANNDIIMFAVDKDNNKFYLGVNGTWYNSGDPTSGATGTGSLADLDANGVVMFGSHNYNNSATELNFGSPSFSISSGNTDGNGYGNFEYAVPSGYFSLNTKNLAEYG
jgi:hypothetical protein